MKELTKAQKARLDEWVRREKERQKQISHDYYVARKIRILLGE